MGFATAAMIASAGMQAGSSIMSGMAASDQAKQQAKIQRRNADALDMDVIATQQKTKFDQVRAVQAGERIVGSMRAKLGKSGALMDEGAPAKAVAEQLFENELQAAMIGHAGATQASKLKQQAGAYRAGATYSDATAKSSEVGGYLSAAGSLLGNVGYMYNQGMFTKDSTPKSQYSTPQTMTPRSTMGAGNQSIWKAGKIAPSYYSGGRGA